MIRSYWFLALVALVLGVATSAAVILVRWGELVAEASGSAPVKDEVTSRERGWSYWSGEIDTLMTDLKHERMTLDARQKDLDALAARVAAEKQELLKARAEIEQMRTEIREQIPVLLEAEKANLKNLSRTYASMQPKQAVAILNELDDATAAKILALMKPQVVAPILQEMAVPIPGNDKPAARAAKLTDQLRLIQQSAPPPPP